MKTYKVVKIIVEVIASKMRYATAGFTEDLTQYYGEHHFITSKAEVGVINLLDERDKWTVLDDIDSYIKLVSPDPESPILSKIQKNAWRFFADLSPLGSIWYFENIMDPIRYKQAETGEKLTDVIDETEVVVSPVPITYHKWIGLSLEEKTELAKKFVLQPVKGNWPIENSPYHESMKAAI